MLFHCKKVFIFVKVKVSVNEHFLKYSFFFQMHGNFVNNRRLAIFFADKRFFSFFGSKKWITSTYNIIVLEHLSSTPNESKILKFITT